MNIECGSRNNGTKGKISNICRTMSKIRYLERFSEKVKKFDNLQIGNMKNIAIRDSSGSTSLSMHSVFKPK